MGRHFFNAQEAADLRQTLEEAKGKGATSGGVFGSVLRPDGRHEGSDIDVLIEDPNASCFGEIDHVEGEQSKSWFHIFRKKPGVVDGGRSADILNKAARETRRLF